MPPSPPFISAELDNFMPGAAPAGFTTNASVVVLDGDSGDVITNASVVIDAVTLAYNATNEDYEGNVLVPPGGAVNFSVTLGNAVYSASGTQFTSYPTISAPTAGATWMPGTANNVVWSGGGPTLNAMYGLGVLDAADANGALVWPLDQGGQQLPLSTTSFSIPAGSVTAGNRLLLAGIVTTVDIPTAALGSSLVVSGLSYVPITVDGLPVTSRQSGTTSTLTGVAWSGAQFVAVGQAGTILTSMDGATWNVQSGPSGTSLCGIVCSPLNGVASSGAQFVAVGGSGTVLTSSDGVHWTSRTSGTTSDLSGIVWSGSQFVAVGAGGTILSSGDGTTWKSQVSGTTAGLNGITWASAQFVTVGQDLSGLGTGVILTSPDAVTWTPQSGNLTGNFPRAVVWSGTQFVAVGEVGLGAYGLVLESSDGTAWGATYPLFVASSNPAVFLGIIWNGTQFVVTGSSGTIVTSPDGTTWTLQASGTTNALSGAASSGTSLVMVGANGTIVTSP